MSDSPHNRRLQPAESWVDSRQIPRNPRLPPQERGRGYRTERGVLTEFALEVVFPTISLCIICALIFLTFLL